MRYARTLFKKKRKLLATVLTFSVIEEVLGFMCSYVNVQGS